MSSISSTSSSSSSSTSATAGTSVGGTLRITGMATGLDVDSLVSKMMTSDQTKIDQLKQKQQTLEWKQQGYQSIISSIQSLQNTYFDITSPTNYLLTQNNYDNLSTSTSDSTVASIKAATGATMGNYQVDVTQVAQPASITGTSLDSQFSVNMLAQWGGQTLNFTDSNSTKATVTIPSGFTGTTDDLVASINSQLTSSSLNGELSAVNDNGKVKFTNSSSASIITMTGGSSIPTIGSDPVTIQANSNYETTDADLSSWNNGTLDFNVGGTDASISLANFKGTTASDLAAYINTQLSSTAANGKVSATVVNTGSGDNIKFTPLTTTNVTISSNNIGDFPSTNSPENITSASLDTALTSLTGGAGLNQALAFNLNYNGNTVTVNLDNSTGDCTVGDLASAISTATGGQVTGSFNDMTGQFTLSTTSTGSTSSIQLTGNSGLSTTLLSSLGLSDSATVTQGTDAALSIEQPGSTTSTSLTENSNNFTLNGITYNLVGMGTTTASVTSNTSSIHSLISGFITQYNSLVDTIQTDLSQKSDPNYPPLTAAQESSMSSTDIANWNAKAQQGLLNNDQNLQNLLNSLRQAFSSPVVSSNGESLTPLTFGDVGTNSIGIDTSNDYTQGAKISIVDDTKFTNAIAQQGSAVMTLFTNTSSLSPTSDPTGYFNESGIFQRINTIFQNYVGQTGTSLNNGILTSYANKQDDYSTTGDQGSGTLPDQLYYEQILINNMNTQYSTDQTKYYNEFSQLDTEMTTLDSQQSALESMMGSSSS